MPTLMAAILLVTARSSPTLRRASTSAMYPPVMEAQRVPPSAWRTSQSMITVRSPMTDVSTTPRRARPTRRWISYVRPPGRPLTDSRCIRSDVAAGSMAYSAVTQPVPLPRRCGGIRSSTVAAHRTWVSPWR